jgi:SAM-dependent methyltransferase
VIVGPFEAIDLPAERFDLVVAATSLHWVDPELALARCGELLRRGGSLALWWNFFGDPNRPDPFHEALQPILRRHAPELIDTTSASGAGGASRSSTTSSSSPRPRSVAWSDAPYLTPIYTALRRPLDE